MSNDTDTDTDETEPETEEQPDEPAQPETRTFQVTAQRVYEVDYQTAQLEHIQQETGAESHEEALEHVLAQQEQQYIDPQEKLLGVSAIVEEQ